MSPPTDPIELFLPATLEAAFVEALPAVALAAARHDVVKERLLARVRSNREAHRTIRAEAGDWESLDAHTQQRVLEDDGAMRTFMLRLAPGACRSAHSHAETESSYVLEGTVRYGAIELKAGDYHVARPGSVHEEVTTETGALLLIRSPVRAPQQGAGRPHE